MSHGSPTKDTMRAPWNSWTLFLMPEMDGISQAESGVAVGSTMFSPPTHRLKGIFKYWCHAVTELARHMAGKMMTNFWELLQQWQLVSNVTTFDYGSMRMTDTVQYLSGKDITGEMSHGSVRLPPNPESLQPSKWKQFSLQERSENKHASRKKQLRSLYLVGFNAKLKHLQYRSARLYNKLKKTCRLQMKSWWIRKTKEIKKLDQLLYYWS